MNKLVIITDKKAVTSSLTIASVFEKQHKDVLRAIENLDCSEDFRQRNFAPTVSYRPNPSGGKDIQSPAYNITRDGFTFLAMGFTGPRAARFKEEYIAAFNLMEKMLLEGTADRRVDVNLRHTRGITNENGLDIKYTLDLTKIALHPTAAGLAMLERITGVDMAGILPDRPEITSGPQASAMQDFFDAHVALVEHNVIPFSVVYSAFRRWCHTSGIRLHILPTSKAFSTFMADRGARKNNTGNRCFTNIELVGI